MKYNLVNDNFYKDYIKNLLSARGVEDVDKFLNPTRDCLAEPTDFENIEKGAKLYLDVLSKEKPQILLIVDSDNDGYTSSAIAYQYTKRLKPECEIDYLLHSGKQHGLEDHCKNIMVDDKVYDLVILPDSSSNDYQYHEQLKERGMPCLVLDHHLADEPFSDNAVIINNQLSPKYRNKELTGAGVVYQFCRYIDKLTGHDWADDYMDLAAWGIIGDMGAVTELENRYLIKTGLANVKNDFLKCLLNKQAYSITGDRYASWSTILEKTNPMSIAFYIVPLTNALIRVGTDDEKNRLFMAFIDGSVQVPCLKRGAKGTYERVDIESARECTNARNHQNAKKEEVVAKLETKIFKNELLDNKVLFVRLEEDDIFPSELNGLIAMQLSAKYKKPTIVARLNPEGFDRGSARGLNQSELKDFKQFLTDSGYFEYAQGHANAFGVSIPDDNLSKFHKYANEALKDIDFGENTYDVNFVRNAHEEDVGDLICAIAKAEDLWGQNNDTPIIVVQNIRIKATDARIMGATGDTMKFEIDGVEYIKFKDKAFIDKINSYPGEINITVLGRPQINNWMGKETPQLLISDYEIKESSIFDF